MRYHGFPLIVIVMAFNAAWAGEQLYAIPIQNEVPVYANELKRLYEKPLFTVSSSQRLLVVELGKNSVKIQDSADNNGWIERRFVSLSRKKAAMKFEPAVIEQWVDLKDPVSIIDGNDQMQTPLILHRSFSEALRDNVDRETIDRQTVQ